MPSYPESETATSPTNSNSYPLSFMSMAMQGPHACLHLKKLPPERPFLRCTVADVEEARLLGSDAARVVKGLPLRFPRLHLNTTVGASPWVLR